MGQEGEGGNPQWHTELTCSESSKVQCPPAAGASPSHGAWGEGLSAACYIYFKGSHSRGSSHGDYIGSEMAHDMLPQYYCAWLEMLNDDF